ncbi:hypothetical protein [Bradymonas sediminis]|uniref:Uncharacterized protein n=1 Tax=Bradymonas sediminis TaxID=1548548 RepID=A0A2Z4FJ82_9DELT|nr:hypothetical protein [Bradymonas sediminis]AWV88983.1 hypothetical protein DN745_06355 [Bradymonas sediminis]TDP71994.1 hypothetical protein DFR33_108208 [Bradymonas sediminis]
MTDQPTDRPGATPGHDASNADVDALQQAFQASLRTISNLPELDMRVAALGATLEARPPREVAWWIDQLMRGALWGKNAEVDAMMACSRWLIRERVDDHYNLIKSVFECAYHDERRAILAILRDPPPHQKLIKGRQLAAPDLKLGREVTLGERRSLARGNNRNIIEKLLRDPNRLVVEQLLQNRNLREADVIYIASSRPNVPEVLREIALHKDWYLRQSVRHTLVMNPYASTGLALKLLPTLSIEKLRQVRNASHLHPLVLETAALLVELREQRTAPWGI